jgi:hypothetical protein
MEREDAEYCAECGHRAHTGCVYCDQGETTSPNGWGNGHNEHGFAEGQTQCPCCPCEYGFPY